MRAPVSATTRRLLAVLTWFQFVCALDAAMVMPLGPRLAEGLGFAAARVPLLQATFAAAASLSALTAMSWLRRVDSRVALLSTSSGLVVAATLMASSTGFGMLVAARVVAGASVGPAAALVVTLTAELLPPARRGWGVGLVMSAISVAAAAGVPGALLIATGFGWRAPFVGLALLGGAATALAWCFWPPFERPRPVGPGHRLPRRRPRRRRGDPRRRAIGRPARRVAHRRRGDGALRRRGAAGVLRPAR